MDFVESQLEMNSLREYINKLKSHYDRQALELKSCSNRNNLLQTSLNELNLKLAEKRKFSSTLEQNYKLKVEEFQRELTMFQTVTVPHYEKENAALTEKNFELQQTISKEAANHLCLNSTSSTNEPIPNNDGAVISAVQNRISNIESELKNLQTITTTCRREHQNVMKTQNNEKEMNSKLMRLLDVKEQKILILRMAY